MWEYIYLKYTDEAAWLAAMAALPPLSDTHIALDVVGTLCDLQGMPIEGWHVNVAVRDDYVMPENLATAVIPAPAFPKRIFA